MPEGVVLIQGHGLDSSGGGFLDGGKYRFNPLIPGGIPFVEPADAVVHRGERNIAEGHVEQILEPASRFTLRVLSDTGYTGYTTLQFDKGTL